MTQSVDEGRIRNITYSYDPKGKKIFGILSFKKISNKNKQILSSKKISNKNKRIFSFKKISNQNKRILHLSTLKEIVWGIS